MTQVKNKKKLEEFKEIFNPDKKFRICNDRSGVSARLGRVYKRNEPLGEAQRGGGTERAKYQAARPKSLAAKSAQILSS